VSATVFYNSPDEIALISNTFQAGGTPADPTAVSCVVTDPGGNATTYTYGGGGTISRIGTGSYTLSVPCTPGQEGSYGLWSYVWIGTGAVMDVSPGTFRTFPLADAVVGMQSWYCGKEELQSRLGITDNNSDYEIQLAIQVVTGWINEYCQRHFNQITEARTFAPRNVWELPIDDLVSTPSVVANVQVNLDYTGDGVYNVPWTRNVNYQLKLGAPADMENNYNINAVGVARPYTQLQVLMGTPGAESPGGEWLPWWWPYTEYNRVQIIGTWGWNAIPPGVSQAALILAVDFFKMKDSFYGQQGVADMGMARVSSNPWVVELLRPYIKWRKKVGV
jgi:hypothetical protein